MLATTEVFRVISGIICTLAFYAKAHRIEILVIFFLSFEDDLKFVLSKSIILSNVMRQPHKLAVLAAVDESKITSVKLVTDLLLTSLRM